MVRRPGLQRVSATLAMHAKRTSKVLGNRRTDQPVLDETTDKVHKQMLLPQTGHFRNYTGLERIRR